MSLLNDHETPHTSKQNPIKIVRVIRVFRGLKYCTTFQFSQLSVRKGDAGNPSLLYKFACDGFEDQL